MRVIQNEWRKVPEENIGKGVSPEEQTLEVAEPHSPSIGLTRG